MNGVYSPFVLFWSVLYCNYMFLRTRTTEQMLDDQDDARSAHSIGIVENPLYSDQEEYDTPSYASLRAKEVRRSKSSTITF